MKTMKKVWRYISKYKKLLFISLTAMIIVQSLGLAAPLIVKSILDDYLVGIERPWYEVSEENKEITFQNRYFSQDVESSDVVSIVIYQGKYYFVEDLVVDGNKSLDGNTLTIIKQDGTEYVYDAELLNKQEVLQFYQPFVQPLIFLVILLTLRFFLQTL
ncbi:MAG: ABC transporter ATP-binding protein, partial [Tenericutes bacterium HGW-Tenericutes-3]